MVCERKRGIGQAKLMLMVNSLSRGILTYRTEYLGVPSTDRRYLNVWVLFSFSLVCSGHCFPFSFSNRFGALAQFLSLKLQVVSGFSTIFTFVFDAWLFPHPYQSLCDTRRPKWRSHLDTMVQFSVLTPRSEQSSP